MQCRLCESNRLLSVLDLGATPPCEKLLTADELDLPEPTFPLHLRVCEDCLLLQIPALITPEDTFTEYAYFSSYSDTWVQHAKTFVDDAADRLGLGLRSFVVEVASNDGYLLQHAVARRIPCLGIEPSVNVGAAARSRGVPTITGFLEEGLAAFVHGRHRPADLVVANNVYAHIPDLLGFTAVATRPTGRRWLVEYRGASRAEPRQSRPIRHDLSRAFPVLHGAFGDARPGHGGVGGCRRRVDPDSWWVDPPVVAPYGSRRSTKRSRRRSATDRTGRRSAPASTVTCNFVRGPRQSATSSSDSCSTAVPRASASSAMERPVRATRSSTTAVSVAICSSTPSTVILTSTVASLRAHAFRSTTRRRSTKTAPTSCSYCRGTSRRN